MTAAGGPVACARVLHRFKCRSRSSWHMILIVSLRFLFIHCLSRHLLLSHVCACACVGEGVGIKIMIRESLKATRDIILQSVRG